MRIRLTGTGWVMAVGCVGLYLASLTSQSALLLFPIGLLLGCVLTNGIAALRAVRGLELSAAECLRMTEGDAPEVFCHLRNGSKRWSGPVVVREGGRGGMVWWRHPGIAPGVEEMSRLERVFDKRGVHRISDLRICSIAPFGLVEGSRKISWRGEIVVHPRIYSVPPPAPAGYEHVLGGKVKGSRTSSSGFEFAGVRGYREGDNWRDIHWKSSSKGAGWMVKQYEEELGGRVGIVIGCRKADGERVEWAVRAAASMIWSALDAGHEVSWVDWRKAEVKRVTPFSGGNDFLDELARLAPAIEEEEARVLSAALEALPARLAVHVILSGWTKEMAKVLELAAGQRKRYTVYLPAGLELGELGETFLNCCWYQSGENADDALRKETVRGPGGMGRAGAAARQVKERS